MRVFKTIAARRVIVAVMLAACLPGCTEWHQRATLAPPPVPGVAEFLRLTLQNGNRVEIHDALIVGDSVIGKTGFGAERARTALALADVKRMEDRQIDAAGTMIAFLGAMLVVVVAKAGSSIHTF